MNGIWRWIDAAAQRIAAHAPAGAPLWVVGLALILAAWIVGSYVGQSRILRPLKWAAIAAAALIAWKLIGG